MATPLGTLSLLLSMPPDLLHGPLALPHSHLPTSFAQPAHSWGLWIFSAQLTGNPAIRVTPVSVLCTSVLTSAGRLLFHGSNTELVSSLEHSLGPPVLDLLLHASLPPTAADLRDPDARPSFPDAPWLTSVFLPIILECSFRTFQKHSLSQWAPRIHYTTRAHLKLLGVLITLRARPAFLTSPLTPTPCLPAGGPAIQAGPGCSAFLALRTFVAKTREVLVRGPRHVPPPLGLVLLCPESHPPRQGELFPPQDSLGETLTPTPLPLTPLGRVPMCSRRPQELNALFP